MYYVYRYKPTTGEYLYLISKHRKERLAQQKVSELKRSAWGRATEAIVYYKIETRKQLTVNQQG